jgi:quinol monooxygenase YgiN
LKTDEDRKNFVRLSTPLVPVARSQAGESFYDILVPEDSKTILSYEAWAPGAEQAHLASPPFAHFVSAIGSTLAGPPNFRHYRTVARGAATARDVAEAYYASWDNLKAGDETAVRATITDDVVFRGTIVAETNGARAFIDGLKGLVTIMKSRRELSAVYSPSEAFVLYEVETTTPAGTVRFADYLRVENGKIKVDTLTFDATALRAATP